MKNVSTVFHSFIVSIATDIRLPWRVLNRCIIPWKLTVVLARAMNCHYLLFLLLSWFPFQNCSVVQATYNSSKNISSLHRNIEIYCNSIVLEINGLPFTESTKSLFNCLICALFKLIEKIDDSTELTNIITIFSGINERVGSRLTFSEKRNSLAYHLTRLTFYMTRFRLGLFIYDVIKSELQNLLRAIPEYFIQINSNTLRIDMNKLKNCKHRPLMNSLIGIFKKIEIINFVIDQSAIQQLLGNLPSDVVSLSFCKCLFKFHSFSPDFSPFKHLAEFKVEKCSLRNNFLRILGSLNPNLQHLSIADNELISKQTAELNQLLNNFPKLAVLNISGNDFDSTKCTSISERILGLVHLKSLDVSNTSLGPGLLSKLGKQKITKLNLVNSGITDAILSQSHKNLWTLPNLIDLSISAGNMQQSLLKFSKHVKAFRQLNMLSIYGIVSEESLSELLLEIDRKYTKTTVYLDDFKKIKLSFIINRIPLKKFYLRIKYQNDRIVSLIPNFNQIELFDVEGVVCEFERTTSTTNGNISNSTVAGFKQFTNLSRLSCLIQSENQLKIIRRLFDNYNFNYIHFQISDCVISSELLVEFLMKQRDLHHLKFTGQQKYDSLICLFFSRTLEQMHEIPLKELNINLPILKTTLFQIMIFAQRSSSLVILSITLGFNYLDLNEFKSPHPFFSIQELRIVSESVDAVLDLPYPKKFILNFPSLEILIINGQRQLLNLDDDEEWDSG